MGVSKRSSVACFFVLLAGCATSSYKVIRSGERGTELIVSPDRVLLECEPLIDADEKGLSGFMMHVLDEENTVLTLVQGNTLDTDSCHRRMKKMSEILRTGKVIFIGGTGDLSEPRRKGRAHVFPRKGTFYSNDRVLGFAVITNEFGACFDAYSGDEKPCPREPFTR
jgi:hypothetical protein